MLEQLIELDKTLFLYLNSLGTSTWDGFWLMVTNKLSSIPLYLILLFITYKQIGVKKTLLLLVSVALMIGFTDQLANFFKYGVQRFRPCHDQEVQILMRLVKSYCGGKYGYFSAHAANSFAIAAFFSMLLYSKFRYIVFLLFLWAAMVAYSRVYIGVHYPLDIATGMCVGIFLGGLFQKLFLLLLRKFF